jgi:hypothetical protein
MHPAAVRADVRRLVDAGLSDPAIARELGLARTTVRDMRSARPGVGRERCPRCWQPARTMRFTAGEYAELLGFYLGDGHIVRAGRTSRLRVSLDARYPVLVRHVRALIAGCFPANEVSIVAADGGGTAIVSMYSSHLPCLFPQHGVGKKHDRPIVLEPWQRALVEQAPWSLLRGLLHSDGCIFINRTGPHRYLSADFCNSSGDIRALFVSTCERVGLRPRSTGDRVRLYRREDVGEITAFVGLKR